jgi:hypothetical protein
MSVWVLIALFGLIKLPLAALMLWLPFRDDAAMRVQEASGPAEDDGGSRTLPGSPRGPRPRWPVPRRPSPHAAGGPARPRRGDRACTPPPRAPRRVRTLTGQQPAAR